MKSKEVVVEAMLGLAAKSIIVGNSPTFDGKFANGLELGAEFFQGEIPGILAYALSHMNGETLESAYAKIQKRTEKDLKEYFDEDVKTAIVDRKTYKKQSS